MAEAVKSLRLRKPASHRSEAVAHARPVLEALPETNCGKNIQAGSQVSGKLTRKDGLDAFTASGKIMLCRSRRHCDINFRRDGRLAMELSLVAGRLKRGRRNIPHLTTRDQTSLDSTALLGAWTVGWSKCSCITGDSASVGILKPAGFMKSIPGTCQVFIA